MKTPKEILKEKGIEDMLQIDTSLPYPKGLRYLTSDAMKEYAKMWVEESAILAMEQCENGLPVGDAVFGLKEKIDAQ